MLRSNVTRPTFALELIINSPGSYKTSMKRILIVAFALTLTAFSSFSIAQQPAFTAADYDRAAKMLGPNTASLIDRAGVRPTFLPDGRFWYMVLTPTGKEHVLINPADGSRKAGQSMAVVG